MIEERSLTEFILSMAEGFEMTGHSPLLSFRANARNVSPAFSFSVGECKLMTDFAVKVTGVDHPAEDRMARKNKLISRRDVLRKSATISAARLSPVLISPGFRGLP